MMTEEQMRDVLKNTNHMVRNSMYGAFWPELEQACRAIESAATAPLLARIAELEAANEGFGKRQEWWNSRMLELERELEEARCKAQEDNYEFNRAINFAIDQGSEACHFLSAWREGDPSGWPEFNAAIKEQT